MTLRLAAWGCVILLAVLSLTPGQELIRTDLAKLGYGKQVEHFIAYGAATLCVGLAYPTRLPRLLVAALLIAYAGLLEIGQIYVPGRGAAIRDFVASAAGVVVGTLALPIAGHLLARFFSTEAGRPTDTRNEPRR